MLISSSKFRNLNVANVLSDTIGYMVCQLCRLSCIDHGRHRPNFSQLLAHMFKYRPVQTETVKMHILYSSRPHLIIILTVAALNYIMKISVTENKCTILS